MIFDKKTIAKKLVALLLLLALFVATPFAFAGQEVVEAANLSDLQDQYDDLEAEQKAIKDKLASLGNSVADAQKRAEYLEEQITATEKQLDLLETQVAEQNKLLAEKTKELEEAEENIASYEEQCLTRLRVNYANSSISYLSLLLSSESFVEFLRRAEFLRVTMEYDNKLLAQMRSDKQTIAEAKVTIEEKKKEMETALKNARTKQANLSAQYEEKQQNIQSIYQTEAQLKARQEKITKEKDALNKQIEQLVQQATGSGAFVGGSWLFPVKFNGWWISSYYGWRTLYGVADFHTGIDFTGGGIYGASVLASNGGTVYYTKPAAGDRTGYGNHIMIDHGGGYFTLYAHLASISVKAGDTVTRGQVIGRVGSTGNSTGPHLHFEIYENKTRKNPYSFLFG